MKARLAVAAVGLGIAAAGPVRAGASNTLSPNVHRVFDIVREGSQIGTNTVDITRAGDATDVTIVTHVLVKVMFVNAYRYDHSETSRYKGNQLVAFNSTTDDNGTSHEITAAQSGGKIAITVDGEPSEAPKGIVPANLWSMDISNKGQLFDPGNGKRLATKPQDLGDETVAIHGVPQQLRHLKLSGGQFDRDLWFDKDGLVKMAMLGSDHSKITSELRLSTAEQ